jgi:hypothetical protein
LTDIFSNLSLFPSAENILEHFQTFQIYLPDPTRKKDNLLLQTRRKMLPEKPETTEKEETK